MLIHYCSMLNHTLPRSRQTGLSADHIRDIRQQRLALIRLDAPYETADKPLQQYVGMGTCRDSQISHPLLSFEKLPIRSPLRTFKQGWRLVGYLWAPVHRYERRNPFWSPVICAGSGATPRVGSIASAMSQRNGRSQNQLDPAYFVRVKEKTSTTASLEFVTP